jgi:hypothetical protein
VGVPQTSVPNVNAGWSFSLAQWVFNDEQWKVLPATSTNLRLSELSLATSRITRRPRIYGHWGRSVTTLPTYGDARFAGAVRNTV